MGNIINANSLNDLKSQASIILLVDANGNALNFPSGGNIGDVIGPGSGTDNAVVRFDTFTGKLIQNSNVTISDGGLLSATSITGTTATFQTINSLSSLNLSGNAVVMTGTSLGSGEPIFAGKSLNTLNFKQISGLGLITISSTDSVVSISGAVGSTLTAPAATTNSGIATWSGTSGGGLRNSTLLINASNNLIPATSGTINIGTYDAPFATGTFNNFVTTRVSGAVTAGFTTVNWALGASHILTWANGQPSGTSILMSGMNAGSSYVLETLNNASGTSVITWAPTVKWQNFMSGSTTSTGSSVDLFTFYYNGSIFLGNAGVNYK